MVVFLFLLSTLSNWNSTLRTMYFLNEGHKDFKITGAAPLFLGGLL